MNTNRGNGLEESPPSCRWMRAPVFLSRPVHVAAQKRIGSMLCRAYKRRVCLREVVKAARDNGCSMRIGVNAGSLERELLERYGEPCPEAMVESALNHA